MPPKAPGAKSAKPVKAEIVQHQKPTKPGKNANKHTDPRTEAIVVEHAPAVVTSSRTGLIKVPSVLMDAAFIELSKSIDKVVKTTGISTASLSGSGFVKNAISTGCLQFDFVNGGGIAPGRFTVIPGREGSGKSTLTNLLAATCVIQGTPIFWFDAEGALSPDYSSKIFSKLGLKFNDLFGVEDDKGHLIVPPIIRYSPDSIGEPIFQTMELIMKMLPTIKQGSDGSYWKLLVSANGAKKWEEDPREGKAQYLFLGDSLPAMLPQMISDDSDKNPMAIQARMFSNCLKTVKSLFTMKNCAFVATNQLRLNPMAGKCVHAQTKITFVDGRVLSIREVVEGKIKGKVWSYDEKTGAIEPKDIVGWHNNGRVEMPKEWITINGFCSFTVTPEHKILTHDGWKQAKDVTIKDQVMTRNESVINGTLREFLAGTSIGDFSLVGWGKQATATLCNNEQPEYLQWKMDKLSPFFGFKEHCHGKYPKVKLDIEVGIKSASAINHKNYVTYPRRDLNLWKDLVGSRSAKNLFDWFTPLSLAIWFMDDGSRDQRQYGRGSISAKRFKFEDDELQALSNLLNKFDIDHRIDSLVGTFFFSSKGFRKLCSIVCKYVPPCMQYKLLPAFQGRYKEFTLKAKTEQLVEYVDIMHIKYGSHKKFRDGRTKYDITVRDNHNYMVGNPRNGIIVHNSDPVFEPCGEAVKFYSDNRTRIMRISPNTAGVPSGSGAKFSVEPGLNGGKDQYVYSKIQNVKNKMFAPFRESMLRIRFLKDDAPGDGICETWDCASYLQATGQMIQYGKTLTMNVMPAKANGRDNGMFTQGQKLTQSQFKELVEHPKYKRMVYMHCLRQMRGGYGFELEREASKRLIAGAKAKGTEGLDIASEEGGIEA
jgi:recombination protein RecA